MDRLRLSLPLFLQTPPPLLCAVGQIPLAKSNGAGNRGGRETISNGGSAGADEQWLLHSISSPMCSPRNWEAFVI